MNERRVRLGLGALMVAATIALAIATAPRTGANAQSANATVTPTGQPAASATATPLTVPGTPGPRDRSLAGNQPTPFPLNTLAPLTGETSLPYPAYGTPVPGVNAGTPAPDVSAVLSLQQSEMIAFARSPLLATARNDVYVEQAEVRIAREGLLPLLSGSADYDYEHSQGGDDLGTTTATGGATGTTGTGTTGTGGVVDESGGPVNVHAAGFAISLSQLIYDGGKIANGVRAARSAEVATADTYRRELQTVAYDVATAYYTYLADERTTQVDLEIVREDNVQLDLVRAQVRAGTEARSDIATVELPVAQAKLAVVRAQGAELSAEAAFVNSMGLDANVKAQPIDDAPVFTSTQVSSIPVPSYDIALKRAIALRPDYDSAEQTVAQNVYLVRQAKLGLFPTLSAAGTADDDTTSTNTSAFRNSQEIGLSLAVPIYDQGATAANTALARANLNNAYASLQNTALAVELAIKQSLTNLVSSRAALDQTEQEYATALVNLKATQAQYQAGVTTLPLLLNAEVQLTQALTDQVTAVYTLRQAEQTYLYQVGSNYDTSARNGKASIDTPVTAAAQGNKVAARGKKKASGGGTGFAR